MVAPLLGPKRLLRAIRGQQDVDHPLARWATDLVEVHEQLVNADPGEISEIDSRRADLVHAIDLWTERCVPQHRYGAAMHTETIGSVIDRIAACHVRALHTLMTLDISRDPQVHSAWQRLAELVGGYGDLAVEVVLGRRRLPAPLSA
ncbi:DUF4254 domain-containing protein [Nocardia sp. ET3-3]|uniref:DUF4254 domain-containing protein n=2 Tax=Nocardia terrae TaxID=2675851 RepID=A0A7K1V2L8_9NOCA|nr:DUF4254 domain-containing protein [Nocardia terrae]